VASNQEIQHAMQTAADAGALQGYVMALEEVNKNITEQIGKYGDLIAAGDDSVAVEERHGLLCEIGCEVDKELERRKAEADPAMAAVAVLVAKLSTSPSRRARLWLAGVLGGAARRLSHP
jgi:hypothetical protein